MTTTNFPKNKQEDKQGGYTGSIILMFRDSAVQKYQFLSNFWPCEVTLPAEEVLLENGEVIMLPAMDFKSTEHAYMAWKTIDLNMRQHIATISPGAAKELTHEESFPLRPDYSDEGRLETMRVVVEQKFSARNPELRQKLLDTWDATIVEGNIWQDDFFGMDLITGEAKNHLGQILMYVRDKIRIDEGLSPVREGVSKKVVERKKVFTSTFRYGE